MMETSTNNGIEVIEIDAVDVVGVSEINELEAAHKYPRDIRVFMEKGLTLVTYSAAFAERCNYTLPRQKKVKVDGVFKWVPIEGPTARFAEAIAVAYQNLKAATRITDIGAKWVTAQGGVRDLENNVSLAFEVKRRIIGSDGKRYNDDLIGLTMNAAASIAYRNAVLKIIPSAYWYPLYEAALKASVGDKDSIQKSRRHYVKEFEKMGVQEYDLLASIGVESIEGVEVKELVTLRGLYNAVIDGDLKVENILPVRTSADALTDKLRKVVDSPDA